MIRIQSCRKILSPRHVFRISRASRTQVENLFLAVEQDGIIGYGEASPNAYFKEDPIDADFALQGLADFFRRQTLRSSQDIARLWEEVWERVAPSRACQCAIDLALWDLLGKLTRRSVSELVQGTSPHAVATSATLGICPREDWPRRIAEVAGFPAIKVKVGADAGVDLEFVRAVRSQSRAAIRVDANCGWKPGDLLPLAAALAELGVEFLEQPLPRELDGEMPGLLRQSPLPILADESCAALEEVPGVVGRFSGFNVKLVKCGGLTPALRMLEAGRRLGLTTMVGCMLESSLLISAGLVAAQESDYADLDGSWLLREDPFTGLSLQEGRWRLPPDPGLGVAPDLPPE